MRAWRAWILLLLYVCSQTFSQNSYEDLQGARRLPYRLTDLMWHYMQRTRERVNAANYIRIRHEESPHFELGYVMGEVLERYRKMMGIIKRPMTFKSDAVFDVIKRTEMVEHLFLDILHLMYMIHEIKRKYSHLEQTAGASGSGYNMGFDDLEEKRKLLLWLQKKRQKEMKKIMKGLSKGQSDYTRRPTKKSSKWWPLDYGWEIDYKWW